MKILISFFCVISWYVTFAYFVLLEKTDPMAAYNRVLLKLSGEALMASRSHGIDPDRLEDYIDEIVEISEMGTQVGIVIGGGNIFRGISGVKAGFDRVKGDYMGMLATVINGLALQSAFSSNSVHSNIFDSKKQRKCIKLEIAFSVQPSAISQTQSQWY